MSGLGPVRGTCLQGCGLAVAHGQDLRVWLLTAACQSQLGTPASTSSAWLGPEAGRRGPSA